MNLSLGMRFFRRLDLSAAIDISQTYALKCRVFVGEIIVVQEKESTVFSGI